MDAGRLGKVEARMASERQRFRLRLHQVVGDTALVAVGIVDLKKKKSVRIGHGTQRSAFVWAAAYESREGGRAVRTSRSDDRYTTERTSASAARRRLCRPPSVTWVTA